MVRGSLVRMVHSMALEVLSMLLVWHRTVRVLLVCRQVQVSVSLGPLA